MRKAILIAVTGILLGASSVQAVPIQYTITGEIREIGSDAVWDLTGSFMLSDPTITYDIYGNPSSVPPATPSPYSENLVQFSMTDFTLSSAIFNATGTGQMALKAVDYIDRYVWLTLGGYQSSASVFSLEAAYVSFAGGSVYTQPASILFGSLGNFALLGGAGAPSYAVNLTADRARVPEPGTLALLGLGLAGLVAHRRRRAVG